MPFAPGYPVGTGGVVTCRSLRPPGQLDASTVRGLWRLESSPREDQTAMVRKGFPVRVRQRASQTLLRRDSLVIGVDRATTSLMHRGSPVRASAVTWSGERGIAAC